MATKKGKGRGGWAKTRSISSIYSKNTLAHVEELSSKSLAPTATTTHVKLSVTTSTPPISPKNAAATLVHQLNVHLQLGARHHKKFQPTAKNHQQFQPAAQLHHQIQVPRQSHMKLKSHQQGYVHVAIEEDMKQRYTRWRYTLYQMFLECKTVKKALANPPVEVDVEDWKYLVKLWQDESWKDEIDRLRKNPPEELQHMSEDEIYDHVLGEAPSSYIRGLGPGPKPKPSSGVATRRCAQVEATTRRAEEAEAQSAKLADELTTVKIELAEMRSNFNQQLLDIQAQLRGEIKQGGNRKTKGSSLHNMSSHSMRTRKAKLREDTEIKAAKVMAIGSVLGLDFSEVDKEVMEEIIRREEEDVARFDAMSALKSKNSKVDD
ncbi:hypothetical protein QYF36_002044 [Acer negundo]|nr:hypothetical protein QYF36_002044 [Acer negundo]